MLTAYLNQNIHKVIEIETHNKELLLDAVWIDMFNPTQVEEKLIEQFTKIAIPTREEMKEIELSSRLYAENDILYMTAIMIAQSESINPESDAVTFILSKKYFITVRYIEPQAFKLFKFNLKKVETNFSSINLFIDFMDTTTDRLSDMLEIIGERLEEYSNFIFRPEIHERNDKLDYQTLLQKIGKNGDLNSKARESLITFLRLISFFNKFYFNDLPKLSQLKITSIYEDLKALGDHVNFLSTKINFLLDATLGMVNIEQNNIIKIFSIAAVIFLPPTLIASIYGMNFSFMPELSWRFGYPFAIILLLISAWLPYKYFKIKKWL